MGTFQCATSSPVVMLRVCLPLTCMSGPALLLMAQPYKLVAWSNAGSKASNGPLKALSNPHFNNLLANKALPWAAEDSYTTTGAAAPCRPSSPQ